MADRALFRLFYLPALGSGIITRWLAEGYREATIGERIVILPAWAISRVVFLIFHALAEAAA